MNRSKRSKKREQVIDNSDEEGDNGVTVDPSDPRD